MSHNNSPSHKRYRHEKRNLKKLVTKSPTTGKQTESLRSHDVIGVVERIRKDTVETVVAYVLECTVCKARKYFSRHVNLLPPLKLYCGTCKNRTVFEVVPEDKWDLKAEFKGKPRREKENGSR